MFPKIEHIQKWEDDHYVEWVEVEFEDGESLCIDPLELKKLVVWSLEHTEVFERLDVD